jgi:hypothetical protein
MIKITTNRNDTYIEHLDHNKKIVINNGITYIPQAKCLVSNCYIPEERQLAETKINILKLESSMLKDSNKIKNISLPIDDPVSIKTAKTVSPNNKYLATITDSGAIKIYDLLCPDNNSIEEYKELNINFNCYESNLSTKEFKRFEVLYKYNMMGFSPDSKKLIVVSDEHITLLSLENKDSWKVCSQLLMPREVVVSEDETSYGYLNFNSFNITDNSVTIAMLSSNTKKESPIDEEEYKELSRIKKENFLNSLPLHCRGIERVIYYKFPTTSYQIKLLNVDLADESSDVQLKEVANIDIEDDPSEILLSPDNNFLLVREGIYLKIFSKNSDNLWTLNQPIINIMDSYKGSVCKRNFDGFPSNALCKFSASGNRLLLRLGGDEIQVYALTNNKWTSVNFAVPATSNNFNYSFIKVAAISADGGYIAISDVNNNISIFKEVTEEGKINYIHNQSIISKDIRSLILIQNINFSEDQQYIIASQCTHTTIYKIQDPTYLHHFLSFVGAAS